MEKTVVVRLERITQHPKYKKYIKVFKKVYAHNEGNKAKVGDWVILRETRPLSRLKRWVVEKIVKKGSLSEGQV
jgi:small subunit ribosomal protein S17